MNRRRFLQAGASAVAIAPASFLYAAGSTSQQIETPHGSLGLTDLKFSPEDLTIHGTVSNHTDRAWRWTTFQLRMRDAAGQPIPHDDRFDGYFYVQNLARNQTKPITDRKGRPARLLLRPTRQPAAIQAEFVPERSYFDSRYVFSMVSPKGAGDMAYEDEYLRLELKPAERLHLHLVNRARQTATIDWEKIGYIDLGGAKHRVIHGETPLMQKDKPQAPRVLDAGATLDTTLYPADMVSGSRIFEDWRLNPLLPLSQYAPHYKWRTFSLLVPWTAGTQTRHLQFTVRIQDVVV